MINLGKITTQQLKDQYYRANLIEQTELECNNLDSANLFLFMLKNKDFFTTKDINNFFKNSILLIDDSKLLFLLLVNSDIEFEKKRDISDRIIELKIPNYNYISAKFYESKAFYNQLGNRPQKTKFEIIRKQVELHCEVVAKSQHETLNQRCLKELKFSNKKIHKRALDMALEKQ